MFCNKCGSEMGEEQAFCTSCGAKSDAIFPDSGTNPAWENIKQARRENSAMNTFSEPHNDPKNKSGKGHLAIGIVCTVLAIALIVFALHMLGVITIGIGSSADLGTAGMGSPADGATEGAGYETPEQALQAYVAALKDLDYDAMASTFAVESYVDNYDAEAYLEFAGTYLVLAPPLGVDALGEFGTDVGLVWREAEIAPMIYLQFLRLTSSDDEIPFDGTMLSLDDYETRDIINMMGGAQNIDAISTIEIKEIVPPETLREEYTGEANVENVRLSASILGATEITSVVALVDVQGEEFYITFDAYKYGDRWYLGRHGGNIGNILGISPYTAGTMVEEDLENGF